MNTQQLVASMKTETLTHRGMKFTLAQDADGKWGYAVDNHLMLNFFCYRDSALKSAQRLIDDMKRQPLF